MKGFSLARSYAPGCGAGLGRRAVDGGLLEHGTRPPSTPVSSIQLRIRTRTRREAAEGDPSPSAGLSLTVAALACTLPRRSPFPSWGGTRFVRWEARLADDTEWTDEQ